MTEQVPEISATETETADKSESKPKPTETVDFWKQKAREQEKRAKENATKAAKFDELEEANKTEVEKATNRATEAEAERDRALTESLRLRVAVKHGVSDEDADLFLTGTDEETLTKQAERLAQRSEDRKKQGNRVPSEGGNPQPQEDEMRTFVHGLFDGGD